MPIPILADLCNISKILKCKSIPLQAWTDPEGSRSSGSQISRKSAHEGGRVVSP